LKAVVSDDAVLFALFRTSAFSPLWEWQDSRVFNPEAGEHEVAIVDAATFRVGSADTEEHLLVSRRVEGPDGVARYETQAFPRSRFLELLEVELSSAARVPDVVDRLLGVSAAMVRVREQIRRLSRFASVPVLILGETGTGKEVAARAVHGASGFTPEHFVGVNCAAVPANLFESELFGTSAGAFTGASKARSGLLEHAAKGTMFLDEVGDLPFDLQPKLLRVLEERAYRRLGSNQNLPLTARIVSATHRSAAQSRVLRRDLFYRLSGFTLVLPPLRERPEDIPLLVRAFLDEFRHRHQVPQLTLADDALRTLTRYSWPGNVRELRLVVERAAILAEANQLTTESLEESIRQARAHDASDSMIPQPRGETLDVAAPPPGRLPRFTPASIPGPDASVALAVLRATAVAQAPVPVAPVSATSVSAALGSHPGLGSASMLQLGKGKTLRDIERQLTEECFERHGRNLSATSQELGIPRSTVRDRLKRYGVLP
jgi:DNA-binding NtrC family response regulator